MYLLYVQYVKKKSEFPFFYIKPSGTTTSKGGLKLEIIYNCLKTTTCIFRKVQIKIDQNQMFTKGIINIYVRMVISDWNHNNHVANTVWHKKNDISYISEMQTRGDLWHNSDFRNGYGVIAYYDYISQITQIFELFVIYHLYWSLPG